ncbi:hypothetical protein ACHAXR_008669 [Thalassiosira sp. AJA248-18]
MPPPTRIATTILLIQLLLLSSFTVLVVATSTNDNNNDDSSSSSSTGIIHDQHSHLTPQQYGHGLARRGRPRPQRNSRSRKKKKEKKENENGPQKTNGKGPPKKKKGEKGPRKKKKKKNGNKNKNGGNKNNGKGNNKPATGGGGGGAGGAGGGKGGGSTPAAIQTLSILSSVSKKIDLELFLYEHPTEGYIPSTIYKHDGLAKGLTVMNTQGVAGMYYYLGGPTSQDGNKATHYGLTNVAAFLAQSMKETIKYDACSENNWDLYGSAGYPLSNACGQLGQSYQDYKCPKGEEHMECSVDDDMEIVATTHAKWYGAPAPFFCEPKKKSGGFTGRWDYGKMCNLGWVDPPLTCDDYPGVIQTTGICNFGKLNYYLGKRAADEGRKTPYGEIDFCKDPEVICSSTKYTELRWIAGMFYWMESVQKYDVGGWNYMNELHKFVDGGFQNRAFIDAVSGIVNRGCHNPPCGTGAVDGGQERNSNFIKALATFKLIDPPK